MQCRYTVCVSIGTWLLSLAVAFLLLTNMLRFCFGMCKVLCIGNRSLMENRRDILASQSSSPTWFVGLDNRFLGLLDIYILYNEETNAWEVANDEDSQCCAKFFDPEETGEGFALLLDYAHVGRRIPLKKGYHILLGRNNSSGKEEKYLNRIEVIECTVDSPTWMRAKSLDMEPIL